MTKCTECNVTDLGVTRIIRNEEEYILCPNCGAEDTVEEIDELEWAEEVALEAADLENDLLTDEDFL
jgi:hypothetical protein